MAYTAGMPTPDIYRLWSGITALSGALERRVWVETGKGKVYPNLYVMLVGYPAIGKSQAVTPVKELWVKCGKFLRVAPDNVTKPALIDLLQRNSRWITEGNPAPSDMEYHCTLLPVPEFGVLMSRHDLEFISVLNYIYDNPPNYREERRTMQGVNPDITNPQLVMLAGAQPDFLASVLPEEAWGMGFCSRIIMIYGSETPQIDLFGAPLENSDSLRDELVADLLELAKDTNYGRMQWQPAAKAALELWYKAGMPPQPNHARLLHYTGRRILQCIKLITISAMARGGSKLILESDVERAKGWLIDAEKVMPDIFRAMLTKNDAELLQELHFSLWRQWATVAPADRKPVPEEAVYNFLSHRIPSEKIAKIIEVAEKSGLLVHNAGGGWIPKPFESLRG